MKLTPAASRKHIELARKHIQELEARAKERRALVEELKRNGLIHSEAKEALVEVESALADRTRHLEFLLQTAPDRVTH
jgi:hypothetical protein